MKRIVTSVLLVILIAPNFAFASSMQDRVCERVVRRFSNDEKMWNRVSERVWKRFQFRCEKPQSSNAKITVPNKKPKKVQYITVPSVQVSDPMATKLTKFYTDMGESFDYILAATNTLPTDISLQILRELKPFPEQRRIVGDFANLASVRRLTEPEYKQLASAMRQLNSMIKSVTALRASYRTKPKYYIPTPTTPTYIPTPTTPTYIPTPTTPTYNQESHKQMCDRMNAELALRGGFGSLDGNNELYEAGCTTLQQKCNGYAIGGIPQYMWPAECR
jgi:hypothetical protein